MKVTEYRTMLYLPHQLYKSCAAVARKEKKSLAALIREALTVYLQRNSAKGKWDSLQAGFGLWKDRDANGIEYENQLRSHWKRRG